MCVCGERRSCLKPPPPPGRPPNTTPLSTPCGSRTSPRCTRTERNVVAMSSAGQRQLAADMLDDMSMNEQYI